jgi:hypothetical protein
VASFKVVPFLKGAGVGPGLAGKSYLDESEYLHFLHNVRPRGFWGSGPGAEFIARSPSLPRREGSRSKKIIASQR